MIRGGCLTEELPVSTRARLGERKALSIRADSTLNLNAARWSFFVARPAASFRP
jgi:hypothetical protein